MQSATELPAQAPLAFSLPRPLGSLLGALRLVGGAPPGRAPCSWLDARGGDVVRVLETRPLEADGARRFAHDDVLWVGEGDGARVFKRGALRSWNRFFPDTLRRSDEGDVLQLLAVSRLGVVDVFDVDRALAMRGAA